MKQRWVPGNEFTLLENGEQYYPCVFDAIRAARREVLIETFILYEDKVGKALREVLMEAARRGVQIDLTMDGFGSPSLSEEYLSGLTAAGVRVHRFDPPPRLLGRHTKLFRRLHRKLVVVDGELAFVGGINFSADHLGDYGPQAKQDYAVAARGPIVAEIHRFMRGELQRASPRWRWFRRRGMTAPPPSALPRAGNAEAMFVWRDNQSHRDDIERHYRLAIRLARERVIIANAYFFPGYRLLKEMRKAARRGVEVTLILQGNPDMAIVKLAASLLYDHLLRARVRIFEYCKRPLHGKVALVDDEWATIGSSNLDPLSLALNLEANVMIRDREFNRRLRDNLEELIAHSCTEIDASRMIRFNLWRVVRGFFLFHFLRRFPYWAGLLPAHAPRLESVPPQQTDAAGVERVTERVE